MWMDDRINRENHCAFPIVSRKWCETLGYFTPGVFHFGYNDTWVFDIAQRVAPMSFSRRSYRRTYALLFSR